MSELDDLLGTGTTATVVTADPLVVPGVTDTQPVAATPAAPVAPVAGAAPTAEQIAAETSFEFGDIPELVRIGGGNHAKRGTKYGFEHFPAPQTGADGKVQYARKFVAYGADVKKSQASINSGVATANKEAKKDGLPNRYTSRKAANGAGSYIIRSE